jgi:hypothetical protein
MGTKDSANSKVSIMPDQALKKRQRRMSTLQMLIDRNAFGFSDEAKIMIAAARRYYEIMTATVELDGRSDVVNSYVDSSLNPSRFDAAIVRSIDQTKAISDLRRGLTSFFSEVLDFIIVEDLTTKETAEKLFLKADSKTEAMTLERLRSALMHLATAKFHMFSEEQKSGT